MNEHLPIDFQARFKPTFLLELVWRRRLIVAVSVVLCVVLAIVDAALTPPIYLSRMIVGPTDELNHTSSVSGGLSDFAALAGLNVATPDSADMQKYKILLTGTLVAAEMERRFGTLREMMPDGWNAKAGRWKRRNEVALGPKELFKSLLGLYRWKDPGPDTLSEMLQKYVVFTDVRKSAFLLVTYRSKDPAKGVQMLSRLHEVTSAFYAQDLAHRANAQIDYIQRTLQTETRQDIRSALISLLEQYSNKLITFNSGQQLLVQLIQPPVAMSDPIWPKPSLMMTLGALIGVVLGIAIAILWPTSESFNSAVRKRLQTEAKQVNSELQRQYSALQKLVRKPRGRP